MRLIQTCTPNGYLYRMTYTRCIDTINSPDDGHMTARNMKWIEINIHEKELCVKLVIYKEYTVNFWIIRVRSTGGMTLIRQNRSIWIKLCPTATLATTDPTWLAWSETPSSALDVQRLTAWAMPQQGYRVYKNSRRFKKLLMVFGLHMLLRLKYSTLDDKIMQHSTSTEIWYTHSAVKHTRPTWSPYLQLHTGTALSLRTAHAERPRLTGERVRVGARESCSVDIAEHATDPDCARGNNDAWNTTEGTHTGMVACLIVRLCVLT